MILHIGLVVVELFLIYFECVTLGEDNSIKNKKSYEAFRKNTLRRTDEQKHVPVPRYRTL